MLFTCVLLSNFNYESLQSTLIKIFEHFSSLVGTASCSTVCLEDQQQRELQQQVLPERRNRLGRANSCDPATLLSNELLKFVRTGSFNDELLPLPFAFRDTTFWPLVEPDV